MLKSIAKKGRPQGFHRTSWGDRIDGLTHLADGRWKVSGSPPIKFTESDERLAVARFHEIVAERNPEKQAGKAKAHGTFTGAFRDVLKRAVEVGGSIKAEVSRDGAFVVTDETLSPAQWAWLRKKLLAEPRWVAEQVGLEKIGWFRDFQEPTESPKLSDLIDLYAAKAGLSANELSRSKLFWREFTKAVGVETVREINHEGVTAYEKVVTGGKYAPKSILHRYRKIRTVFQYAIKRGRGIEDCRRALDVTKMLEVKNHTPLDPRPIAVDQFWPIHAKAIEAGDTVFAALMLTALNCAMYGGEVSALRWDEVNLTTGELVTRRPKTGVSRIAILWPQTLSALRKIDRQGEFIFYSARRSYYANAVVKVWRRYCEDAEVGKDVVFSQLRDAAFSTACGISVDQAKLLAGHRLTGASDHYVRRNPALVSNACQAVRSVFYAPTKDRKVKRRKAA